jgi:AcrR family transcriptional regulator
MGRIALSDEEVEAQRARVVGAAETLFAELGYEGVTLRAIAKSLGQSHTAVYRYFGSKAEIFTSARIAAYNRFAEAQEQAARQSDDPIERLDLLGDAYVKFAVEEPDAYRLMFELRQPAEARTPELGAAEDRAWSSIHEGIKSATGAGVLDGDSRVLAHLFWSGLHGVVSLHLAGKLSHGADLESLHGPMKLLLFAGSQQSSES